MSKTRTWSAATAGVCVLVVLAAWFLLISPKRAEAADLRDQTVAQDQANAQSKLKIKQLKAQYAELPAKQAELAIIKQQLPDNPALPSLIRSLSAMADASGVSLTSVAPGPPARFAGAPAAGTVTPVAPTAAAAGANATQLLGIPTTIVVSGDYSETTLFLQKLQAANVTASKSQLGRAYLVQGLQVVPDDGVKTADGAAPAASGKVKTTITGQIFVLQTGAVPTVTIPTTGSGSPS